MIRCPGCQHENPAGVKFCGECGSRLEVVCPLCQSANPPSNKFCFQCGGALVGGTSTPKPPSPESYTPKHLAEKILTSKAALEGERKQVTVLFADLKGSMELLADRDPEDARKLLDPVLEHMMEAVHRFEGTVNQVMGDGIMALFGAPVAHEDHAVRACYAALRMQESVKRYADGVFRSFGVPIQIRVGLNSGDVVVRAIGSDLHMDYTAVGQSTHLAARMEQMARPGTILLTPETLALAEGFVQVASRGPVPVKGLAGPIEIFELTGAGAARTRLQAAALRGLTRFVGRDAEIEHLRRGLAEAQAGRGQVVAIVGEAGVGKSRLVHEFTQSHRVQDWLILGGAAVSYGKTTSYLPVIDLLKGYFKIGDRDDHREMRAKVLGRVLGLDRAMEALLPPLLALLDVPVEDEAWGKLDPPERRRRTLDAIRHLLVRESQAQPLLVVFEDLHWADAGTQALLDSLVESVGSTRMLLLVNYRPEYQHRWGSKTAYSHLRLDSLRAESAAELLVVLLGPEPGLASLTQMLVRRGNPFFLEETVRTMVETGALVGEPGAYRLTRPVEGLQVPATVQTILAARIDRLPAEEKSLLQAASVIGRHVPYALLAAIADQPESRLRQGLAHLQEAEFLYETQLFPDLELTFKHALTQEVSYGSLVHERRRALHARIADAIERLSAERPGEQVERVAQHAVRGESWEKAFVYLRRAGAKAAERLALREAATALEQATSVAGRLPRQRELMEQAIDLCIQLRGVLFPLSEFDKVNIHLKSAAALATEIGDQTRLAQSTVFEAHYHCIIAGDMSQALECVHRAVDLASTTGSAPIQAGARFVLGLVLHGCGRFGEAVGTLSDNVHRMRADNLEDERAGFGLPIVVASRVWLSFALAELGRFADGFAAADAAIAHAESLAQPYSIYHAYWARAAVHLAKGDAAGIRESVARIEQITGEVFQLAANAAGLLGYANALSERTAEAIECLEGLVLRGTPRRNAYSPRPRHVLSLGETYLLAGQPARALDTVREVLEQSIALGQRGNEAYALCLVGDAHAALGAHAEADASYREAITLAGELAMRPLVAHCHRGLGQLARRTGKRDQAHEHLTTATTMYREMDMRFYLEQAEAQLREVTE